MFCGADAEAGSACPCCAEVVETEVGLGSLVGGVVAWSLLCPYAAAEQLKMARRIMAFVVLANENFKMDPPQGIP